MGIDLSDYEKGAKFDGDYSDALEALQKRLATFTGHLATVGKRLCETIDRRV